MISALFSGSKVFPPGGHNVAGILGQIGAVLELAEQIERAEMPDPEAIYVAYGSGCTTTGLLIGVAISHYLGLKAFQSPTFKIVSVVVHHLFALGHRYTGFLFWHSMPLSVAFSIDQVSAYLKAMGGPDINELAHRMRKEHLEIITDPQYVGRYGAHSAASLEAAQSYDDTSKVSGPEHNGFKAAESQQWLCGHFAAKPYALMAERLSHGAHHGRPVLFWQTKSIVQPRGETDELQAFNAAAPASLKKWARDGKAHSRLRPGDFPDNYQHLMTRIPS